MSTFAFPFNRLRNLQARSCLRFAITGRVRQGEIQAVRQGQRETQDPGAGLHRRVGEVTCAWGLEDHLQLGENPKLGIGKTLVLPLARAQEKSRKEGVTCKEDWVGLLKNNF